ncbi:Hydroxymethylpyrimidine ABC transporter, transmembrane component [Burkholderiales bacterium 8X]|nr:Hydroxymethylpyrimidine ABC transporter, transmembrane component [Burkholderiales bacterium 8X]
MQKLLSALNRKKSLIIMLVLFCLVWQFAVQVFKIRPFLLPAPSQIIAEFLAYPQFFLKESLYTLWTTFAGFLVAVIVGVTCGIGIVYSRFLEETVYTFLVGLNSVPKVALAPLFVIWMGTGVESKIAIGMMIAVFPILIATVMGLKSIDPEMLNMARAAHASKVDALWKVRMPNALPSILSGMKVAISFALVGAIVGEFVAGDTGLGHVILVAQGAFETPRVFVALVLLGVLGTILFAAIELMERLLVSWHVSQRGGHGASQTILSI